MQSILGTRFSAKVTSRLPIGRSPAALSSLQLKDPRGIHNRLCRHARNLQSMLLAAAVTLSGCLSLSWSDEHSEVSQFVTPTTVVVARADTDRLGFPEVLVTAAEQHSQQLLRWQRSVAQRWQQLLEEVGQAPIFATVDIPLSRRQAWLRMFVKNRPDLDVTVLTGRDPDQKPIQLGNYTEPDRQPIESGDYLAFVPLGSIRDTQEVALEAEISDGRRADLNSAFQSISGYPLQFAVLPPDSAWRTLDELLPELPVALGGSPSSVLTDGVQWAGVAIEPADLTMTATIQSRSPAAAVAFAEFLPKLLKSSVRFWFNPEDERRIAIVDRLIDSLEIEVVENRVLARSPSLNGESGRELLTGLIDSVVAPISQDAKQQRLRRIGLAILNYESAYRRLPPNAKTLNEERNTQLSWRVHILPFLGEAERELYGKFALDEPWDSPTNQPLLQEMPDVFKSYPDELIIPSDIQPGHTTFLAPSSEQTIFGSPDVVKIATITDGTSNTLYAVEVQADLAVPWTAPRDYDFDPANPAAGLEVGPDGTVVALMADGSTYALPADLPDDTWHHLFLMNDGQVVRWRD